MNWDEREHPRDDIGRFTFKNGEGGVNIDNDTPPLKGGVETTVDNSSKNKTQNAADVLYEKSRAQERVKNAVNECKNILLAVLGDLATHADVLYGTIGDLMKKIKENKLDEKLKQTMLEALYETTNPVSVPIIKYIIGEKYNKYKDAIEELSGVDTAGMLGIAHGEEKMNHLGYIEDTYKLDNYNDPIVKQYREYLKNKIGTQFKDYGFSPEDIKGYYFKNNSEPSQRMLQNEDFINFVKNNKDKILSDDPKLSINFPKHGFMGVLKENNFKNAIGKADIKNIYLDKAGNLHLHVVDTYDFNKNAKDPLNTAGREEMQKGTLKPFFTIHEILIPKDNLDKIWNEKN